MRRLLISLTLACLPAALGCRNSPSAVPPAAAGPNQLGLGAKSPKTQQQLAIESILRRGGQIQVDPDDLQKAVVRVDLHGFYNAVAALDSVAPLTKLREVNLYNTGFTDGDLERLRGLPDLEAVNLSGTKITDNGLAVLQTLPKLHKLELANTRITDAGLQYLRGLRNLEELSLYGTKVTDEGLAQLNNVQTLHKLTLGDSKSITDRGVVHLQKMSQLRTLLVVDTGISKAGFADLKAGSSHRLQIIDR